MHKVTIKTKIYSEKLAKKIELNIPAPRLENYIIPNTNKNILQK